MKRKGKNVGKVIVVTSGKGGVGKTTATANIGAGLASQGHSVVLIDTDIGLRNLDLVLGLENRIVFDLVDVVEGKCRSFRQAMIKDKRFDNLFILASAQSREKDAVKPKQMKKLCEELRNAYDFILLDCPAGIEMGFKNAIAGADEAIVVTNPEVSAVRDADRIVGLLEAAEVELKPFDVVVQRGTNHAWEAIGDGPALLCAVLIDASFTDAGSALEPSPHGSRA